MPQLSRNQWIGTIVALVIVILAFGSLFYFSINPSSQTSMNDQTTNTTNDVATSSAGITTLPNGLIIQDITIGTGADVAAAGDSVMVNYIGKLTNGNEFDNSFKRGQPIAFTLGAGQVIQGWEQGIAGMKVGGERILTIPADLAYGNRAMGDLIPANSTLVFDVTLTGIKKQ